MGNLLAKYRSQDPRTIAEAKAEIKTTLRKIQDHYDAINRMRLEDRNKWKYFNKKVEELEVVKARALKLERKRLRDTERAKERAELEENMKTNFIQMSREFVASPYGSKKPIVYPNLQKQREEAAQKAAKSDLDFLLKTAEEIKVEDRSPAPASAKRSSSGTKMLDVDPTQRSVDVDREEIEPSNKSGTGSMKSPKTPRTPGSDIDELFIEIDSEMNRKEDTGPIEDVNVHKAKLVSVPTIKDESVDDAKLNNSYQIA